MKVIIASFQYEACGNSSMLPTVGDFEYAEKDDIYKKLRVDDIFADAGIEAVPLIYANALPGGVCPVALYERFAGQIGNGVKENAGADGILLCFHGSSEIEGLGSGELELMRRIRKIAGFKPLIAVSFDLHANIDERLIGMADIVCGYKTAPHTDQTQTQRAAARLLIGAMIEGYRPAVKIVKVPMLLTGDTMLTKFQPLKTLMAETVEAEVGDVLRVNLFFSHMWVDAPNTCACVVVTAKTAETAQAVAEKFADKFWSTRKSYKFREFTGSVQECVANALAYLGGRVFLTDSGDNTTAGAEGNRTEILEQFLKSRSAGKKICVSGITSQEIYRSAARSRIGDWLSIKLNGKVRRGKITAFGKILGWAKDIVGGSVSVCFGGGVTAIFTEKRSAFIARENFDCANEKLEEYDIVAVKLGYLFSELAPFCKKQFFVLTDGASCVDIERLNLKRIPRPMYPLDDFHFKA